MHLVTIALHGLAPSRIEPVRLALTRFFDGRLVWVNRGARVLAIGQHVDDDHTDGEHLRLTVAEIALRAHCEPCRGSVMTYAIRGPCTPLDEAALALGLDLGRLSAVDQLAALVRTSGTQPARLPGTCALRQR